MRGHFWQNQDKQRVFGEWMRDRFYDRQYLAKINAVRIGAYRFLKFRVISRNASSR